MKSIKELEFPKIKNVIFANTQPRKKRATRVHLYLGIDQTIDTNPDYADGPSLKVRLEIVWEDIIGMEQSEIIEMPKELEFKYIPDFSISKDCFITECIFEGNSFKDTFQCLVAMMLINKGNPKVIITKDDTNLTIEFSVQDFVTQQSIDLNSVTGLFK